MPIQLNEMAESNVLEIEARGELTAKDYAIFLPKIEEYIKAAGKVNLLFAIKDVSGWTAKAAWEDLRFDIKHFNDVERIAILGDKKWQEVMTYLGKPFTGATMKYFSADHRVEALAWIKGEKPL